jgi:hypothetical protein
VKHSRSLPKPSPCNALDLRIRQLIFDGATRYRKDKTYDQIKRAIARLARECSATRASYLGVVLDHGFSHDSVPNLSLRLRALLSRSDIEPATQVAALSLLARLEHTGMPQPENYALRERALAIARANGLVKEELIVLSNWAYAHYSMKEFAAASDRLADAEKVLALLSKEAMEADPQLIHAVSRLFAHKAEALFASILDGTANDPVAVIDEGNKLFDSGIEAIAENDHYRINLQIDRAEALQVLATAGRPRALELAKSSLDAAHTGLDSHNCDLCRAYYDHVRAKVLLQSGRRDRTLDPRSARNSFEEGIESCSGSLGLYQKVVHPNTRWVLETKEELMAELQSINRPRKIFLSHKSANKALVLRFKETLELLKFEPWLDSDAMPAGVGLERGILQGFKESCAVVFFITPEFKDESFLATEIDYAISEKRSKGDTFSIITLLFSNTGQQKAMVPDLLRNFVWKEPPDELAALRELVRALPLAVSYPDWP